MMTALNKETGSRLPTGVPVLMYHSIASGAAPKFRRFTVDPGEFAMQLDYLRDQGYRSLTAREFAERGWMSASENSRLVVLTFDDAYSDFYTAALPMLQDHGFTATLFVPTAYVGCTARWLVPEGEGDRALLSWSALRDIASERIELAAHSHTHPEMDLLSRSALVEQTTLPRRLLEDNLAMPVTGFAYPFGYWRRRTRQAVAAAGYAYAFGVDELMASAASDTFAIPRITVTAGLGVEGLAKVLDGSEAPLGRRLLDTKRLAWQVMRRARRGSAAGSHDV